MINLHEESIYLQGARNLLLMLKENAVINFTGKPFPKQVKLYDDAVMGFLLSNRDNLKRFIAGDALRFYNHKHKNDNPKDKLVSVNVCFDEDYKKLKTKQDE